MTSIIAVKCEAKHNDNLLQLCSDYCHDPEFCCLALGLCPCCEYIYGIFAAFDCFKEQLESDGDFNEDYDGDYLHIDTNTLITMTELFELSKRNPIFNGGFPIDIYNVYDFANKLYFNSLFCVFIYFDSSLVTVDHL